MSNDLEKLIINEPSNEDTIQCFFFATEANADSISWNHLCMKINIAIQSISRDYLWHKDAFEVFVPVNQTNIEDFPPHLSGTTTFGDNIEDEWFIVHIILELTKQHKDLIVQIHDNDGDFLLIEAADHLPQWANPETSENRVFIHNNHIHLIPPKVASIDEKLALNDAIQFILKSPDETQVSHEIEKAILRRIGNYPDKIKDNIHNALVKVPLEVGALLKLKPNLIAPLVDAYCHHDPIDAKAFKNISCNNWFTVPVKFTKCLYAMLLYSKVANTIRQPKDRKISLGIKLACAYQMIMNRSSEIFSSKEYIKFINSLNENGYFNNNIEGSKEYKMKLENAKKFFTAVECPTAANLSHDITQIMASGEYLKTKELLQSNSMTTFTDAEDNDDWLTLQPEQLNELLNSRYGKKTKFQKGDVLTPQNITSELNKFLRNSSDFEGIETNNSDNLDNNIDFNADQFEECIEKMLKLLSSNNDDVESIDSNFSEESMPLSEEENDVDMELKSKLHEPVENLNNNDTIIKNMIKSMKEEKASVGPSSNIISNVGLHKTYFIDSDDDYD